MKMLRKAVAFALAVLMAVNVFYGVNTNANASAETTVVYFDNANTKWSAVCAYIWGGSQGTQTVKGTKVEGNIFKMNIPADYSNILFKNTQSGWNKQTANTNIQNDDKNCFKPKSSSNKTSGSWYHYDDKSVVTSTPFEYIPVIFDNDNTTWKDVYTYVWNSTDDFAVFEPQEVRGETWNKDPYGYWHHGPRYCIFSIPNNYAHILFKNVNSTSEWDKQTVDLSMPSSNENMFWVTDRNEEGKYYGTWKVMPTPEPTTPATTAPEPTAPATTAPATTAPATTAPATKVPVTKVPITTAPVTEAPATQTPSDNLVDVYYTTNYSVPSIHYKKADGEWTTVPGEAMKKNAMVATYTVDLGNLNETKVCFNDWYGKVWDSNGGKNYTLKKGYNAHIKDGKVTYVERKKTTGDTKKIAFQDNPHSWDEAYKDISWDCSVFAYAWTSPTDFEIFEPVQELESWGKDRHGAWYRDDIFVFDIPTKYTHVLFKNTYDTWEKQTVDLEMPQGTQILFEKSGINSEGKYTGNWSNFDIPTKTPTPTVEPTATVAPTATATPVPGKTVCFCDGQTTKWSMSYAYVWNTPQDATCFKPVLVSKSIHNRIYKYKITGNYENILFKNTEGTTNWDKQTCDLKMPTDKNNCYYYGVELTGTHQEFWTTADYIAKAETITPAPTSTPATETVNVYYTTSYSTPYIHYITSTGAWTKAPGEKMNKDGNVASYTINLGTLSEGKACFNNGSGKWDNNGGKNYVIKKGYDIYIDNGKVTYKER